MIEGLDIIFKKCLVFFCILILFKVVIGLGKFFRVKFLYLLDRELGVLFKCRGLSIVL